MYLVDWEKSLISLQNRSFTPTELFELAAMCSGGKATAGYFQMLELQVSEFLFHVEIINKVNERAQPKEDKSSVYGGSLEWE